MSPNDVLIFAGTELATFLFSIIGALLVAGIKWGRVTTDVAYIKRDVKELRDTFILTPAARDRASKE